MTEARYNRRVLLLVFIFKWIIFVSFNSLLKGKVFALHTTRNTQPPPFYITWENTNETPCPIKTKLRSVQKTRPLLSEHFLSKIFLNKILVTFHVFQHRINRVFNFGPEISKKVMNSLFKLMLPSRIETLNLAALIYCNFL